MYRSLLLNMLLLCIVYGAGMNYTGPCTSTSKLEFSHSPDAQMCNTQCRTQFNYIISLRIREYYRTIANECPLLHFKVRHSHNKTNQVSPSYCKIKTEHLVFYLENLERNEIIELPPLVRGKSMKSAPPPRRVNFGQHFFSKDFTFFRTHRKEPDKRGGGL
jgi:hypothetical protein